MTPEIKSLLSADKLYWQVMQTSQQAGRGCIRISNSQADQLQSNQVAQCTRTQTVVEAQATSRILLLSVYNKINLASVIILHVHRGWLNAWSGQPQIFARGMKCSFKFQVFKFYFITTIWNRNSNNIQEANDMEWKQWEDLKGSKSR